MSKAASRPRGPTPTPAQDTPAFDVRVGSSSLIGTLLKAMLEQLYPDTNVALITAPTDGLGPGDVGVESRTTGRRLVVFTSPPSTESVSRQIGLNTWSLLTVEASRDELCAAVDSLTSGPPYVSATIVRALAGEPRSEPGTPIAPLSARELEVLPLLGEGYSNAEIAEALCISPNTVRSHLQSMSSKLGTSRRAKLVARARSVGLIV